ncbi:hypothetical protein C8J57DRAFT_976590, partial [Mycena rebaudengoi]
RMDYVHYEESIVLKYGILLEGWTCDKFVNPSDLSSSLPVLTTLRDALRNGGCKWVKLQPELLKQRKLKWAANVAAGKATPRMHQPRSDLGKKRK